MTEPDPIPIVRDIMQDFARLSGLDPPSPSPHRYLWTDAFAVCNFLALHRRTGDFVCRDLALHLVGQVHHVLGRHRDDDPRRGWISGLGEREGKQHPTIGGLRIGKKLNERMPGEPMDERLEWDRDGQYYHYLTKWMHALNCVARVTGNPEYFRWAVELAKTAHARFTYARPGGQKSMVWKMSIDLSRPLVPSMGMHDPLDGLATFCTLQMAVDSYRLTSPLPGLHTEISELAEMCRNREWTTDDPLGIGGLLFDASRITQLMAKGGFAYPDMLEDIMDSAHYGLEAFRRSRLLQLPAAYRLAFRELGLSIGLKCLDELSETIRRNPGIFDKKDPIYSKIPKLMKYEPLAGMIEQFWLDEKNRMAGTWTEHREINRVMLATSLAPEGFITI